jgi:homoserine O-acetyltransferase
MTRPVSSLLQHALLVACLGWLPWLTAHADVGLVEKKVFELPAYTTVGGQPLKNVRVGYETYGRLNERGDNAIFVAHFFSGTSHAAGKYRESDKQPGYWDALIGKGRPIDTDKYFVVSADALTNLNVRDPDVTTTGPASLNPQTGKPYGLDFPVVALRDSVRVHKALVDSLGVKKLAAVIGASGGSIQAMEWGALYPQQVARVIHVIGPGFDIHPFVIGLLDAWAAPIRLDPRWNRGDYHGRDEPLDGVAQSLALVTLTARAHGWAEQAFGYKSADEKKDPAAALAHPFQIEAALQGGGQARARSTDANSVLYTVKANQLYRLSEAEIKGIQAKILFLPAASDMIFPPALSERAMQRFKALGGRAEMVVLAGHGGHLDGVLALTQAGEVIRRFIETPP